MITFVYSFLTNIQLLKTSSRPQSLAFPSPGQIRLFISFFRLRWHIVLKGSTRGSDWKRLGHLVERNSLWLYFEVKYIISIKSVVLKDHITWTVTAKRRGRLMMVSLWLCRTRGLSRKRWISALELYCVALRERLIPFRVYSASFPFTSAIHCELYDKAIDVVMFKFNLIPQNAMHQHNPTPRWPSTKSGVSVGKGRVNWGWNSYLLWTATQSTTVLLGEPSRTRKV